ncbi:hypothetical protein EO98_16975 [Methanosarcina sp. 2.H.T.1A.6]|nr:hypothetical protein EO94_04030 [Methanosarcina sp. 2.H.T.1A.3]KKG20752.1 hypothetical protein EO96_18020 [Methanosarcina sp. 2.H.T.1A.8]KKG22069.1 hypothetical protein EO98_16975 [Methanosarcina sp. 2.H.T.1A.6]KKG29494.1 hypothetical protein EO97_06775 [Methanosarcina sp. 2.H.T.1A.15]
MGDAEKKAGYPIHSHDVVIVGAGLTGLRAAIETVNRGLDTAIISRVHPLPPPFRSSSRWDKYSPWWGQVQGLP